MLSFSFFFLLHACECTTERSQVKKGGEGDDDTCLADAGGGIRDDHHLVGHVLGEGRGKEGRQKPEEVLGR